MEHELEDRGLNNDADEMQYGKSLANQRMENSNEDNGQMINIQTANQINYWASNIWTQTISLTLCGAVFIGLLCSYIHLIYTSCMHICQRRRRSYHPDSILVRMRVSIEIVGQIRRQPNIIADHRTPVEYMRVVKLFRDSRSSCFCVYFIKFNRHTKVIVVNLLRWSAGITAKVRNFRECGDSKCWSIFLSYSSMYWLRW